MTGGATVTRGQAVFANLVARHCAAEVAHDIDGVLATVRPEPWFELHPLGLALTTSGLSRSSIGACSRRSAI